MSVSKWKLSLLPRLPLIYLLLGLSTLFLFGGDRKYFYRHGHHNWVSSEHLTNAVNLSPDHNFLVFTRQIYSDGGSWYDAYNRFPPIGYALIKIATLPFGGLSTRIFVARILMLVFFAMTAVIVYWSLNRLTSNRWVSLTATLVAFSSYYCIYYMDMISNEITVGLFGTILTFHAMIIFEQEGRYKQLVAKSCIAILLDWHVLSLLLAFITLGLARNALHIWNRRKKESRLHRQKKSLRCVGQFKLLLKMGWRELVCNRYILLLVIVIMLTMGVLAYNIGQEYFALNAYREISITELPSIKSLQGRTGLAPSLLGDLHVQGEAIKSFTWLPFLEQQLAQIGVMSIPLSFYRLLSNGDMWIQFSFYTGIVLATCIGGVGLLHHRMLTSTLLVSGFLWAIPMRYNTIFHEYETVFYIGIPLVFVAILMVSIQRLFGNFPLPYLATLALFGFISSTYQASNIGQGEEGIRFHEATVQDLEVIRPITSGENVLIPIEDSYSPHIEFAGVRHGLDYYLSGSGIAFNDTEPSIRMRPPRFMIKRERTEESYSLLTPDNRLVFLYDFEGS